jgi:hypothetical protein
LFIRYLIFVIGHCRCADQLTPNDRLAISWL